MASKPQSSRVLESDPWARGSYTREEIRRALLEGGMAGVVSHDRPNVVWKLGKLCDGDPSSQFGIRGVDVDTFEQVIAIMAEASGFDPDPSVRHGLVRVDAGKVIDRLERVGDRLALAAQGGERVLLATGHPNGLPLLYAATGRLLEKHGATLITPADGRVIDEGRKRRVIRYEDRVGMLTNGVKGIHTHSPAGMRRMLEEEVPDLVFADHGFAGAAIEIVSTPASIADVNDPALVVAEAKGRGGPVVVMDDNVEPEDYWPCFQVIASRFPD
ncbi:MAG TPA: phosphatase [Actinomycetota bacterium]|nr:phosphatase [Actinomycetota bacterium]